MTTDHKKLWSAPFFVLLAIGLGLFSTLFTELLYFPDSSFSAFIMDSKYVVIRVSYLNMAKAVFFTLLVFLLILFIVFIGGSKPGDGGGSYSMQNALRNTYRFIRDMSPIKWWTLTGFWATKGLSIVWNWLELAPFSSLLKTIVVISGLMLYGYSLLVHQGFIQMVEHLFYVAQARINRALYGPIHLSERMFPDVPTSDSDNTLRQANDIVASQDNNGAGAYTEGVNAGASTSVVVEQNVAAAPVSDQAVAPTMDVGVQFPSLGYMEVGDLVASGSIVGSVVGMALRTWWSK